MESLIVIGLYKRLKLKLGLEIEILKRGIETQLIFMPWPIRGGERK